MTDEVRVQDIGVAVGAMVVTRRVVLSNKEDITFQVPADATIGKEDLFQILDTISEASDRERLKADLAVRLEAHKIAQEQPAELDKEIRRLHRERAAQVAGFQAAHSASAKRSDWRPSERQQQAIAQYEAQIAAAEASRENFKRDLPIIQWEIDRLKALIAGHGEPPRPEQLQIAIDDLRSAAD